MAQDTYERDLNVLEAAVRLIDQDQLMVGPRAREIANDTGLELEQVVRAMVRLEDTGYFLDVKKVMGAVAAAAATS